MATYYIDPTAAGTGSGLSWANAKTSLSFSGFSLAAGDIVYISGGPSGGSGQPYILAGEFSSIAGFAGGSASNPVTYKIGQDSAHNGIATFTRGSGGTQWLYGATANVVISGDAGDGAMHFVLSGYTVGMVLTTGAINYRVSYVNFGSLAALASLNDAGPGLELDHCYAFGNSTITDGMIACTSLNGTTWDDNRFHHNTIYAPYDTALDGFGTDLIQMTGDGFSIYDNILYGTPLAGARGNHQDGWQGTGNCTYIKVYNNLFIDIQNYAIFQEPAFGGYTHSRIYNNICVKTGTAGDQAIAVSAVPTKILIDCVVANNVMVNYTNPLTFRDPGSYPTSSGSFVSCYAYNNLVVGIGTNLFDTVVTIASNVTRSNAQAASEFISFVAGLTTNDYHLTSSATTLIGTGTDASALIGLLDKDGISRASWDVGPYAYTTSIAGQGISLGGSTTIGGKHY